MGRTSGPKRHRTIRVHSGASPQWPLVYDQERIQSPVDVFDVPISMEAFEADVFLVPTCLSHYLDKSADLDREDVLYMQLVAGSTLCEYSLILRHSRIAQAVFTHQTVIESQHFQVGDQLVCCQEQCRHVARRQGDLGKRSFCLNSLTQDRQR